MQGSDRRPSAGTIPVDGCTAMEVSIPMDLGTIVVDTRSAPMEALIDEAGGKRPRVEGGSSSVCRSAREGLRLRRAPVRWSLRLPRPIQAVSERRMRI